MTCRPRSLARSRSKNGGAWKVGLIEERNPDWIDLAIDLGFGSVALKVTHMDPRIRGMTKTG